MGTDGENQAKTIELLEKGNFQVYISFPIIKKGTVIGFSRLHLRIEAIGFVFTTLRDIPFA